MLYLGPGFSYDSCADLDPDCWKYEMHGLCSDSPDLAEKRYNCKKTCHLCVRFVNLNETLSYTRFREKRFPLKKKQFVPQLPPSSRRPGAAAGEK